MAKTKKEKKEDIAGLFIPAGIFIGMGLGFIFEQLVAGIFLGLGIGFIGMAITKIILNKK